ncbi:MAG: VCBS repeat-containing protein, partial [Myxococcota bacterium]|nr:VCBS repeat-containing protein [Myxococcota bacterium]
IVAASDGADVIYVLDHAGAMLWRTPEGSLGGHGVTARFADFDGDGADDMYAAAGWASDLAHVYSFASGAASPTRLFQLETGRRDYVIDQHDALGDFDGDGNVEILVEGHQYVYLFSGADGRLLGVSPSVGGIPYGFAMTNVADVDVDGADEAVLWVNSSYGGTFSRRVFLMGWDPVGRRLVRRWEMSAADPANDDHRFAQNGLADLDGDGIMEVVTSFWSGATRRTTTYVLDARDGTVVDSVSDATVAGLADIDGDGRAEVLVGNDAGDLSAFSLVARSLDWRWTLPGRSVAVALDPARAARQSGQYVPLQVDVDRDGRDELLLYRRDAAGDVVEVLAYNAEVAPPTVAASYSLPAGVVPLTSQPFLDLSGPGAGPEVALARNDGFMIILGRDLLPLNEPASDQTGLRIGGFYSGAWGFGAGPPIATDLEGDGVMDVVVRNSRGALVRLDVSAASLVAGASTVWARPREWYPTAVDLDGDAHKEVVVVAGPIRPTDLPSVRAVTASGATVLWERVVPAAGHSVAYDLPPAGDVNGDGAPDLLYQSYCPDSVQRVNLISGRDGRFLWPTPYERSYAGCGFGGAATTDLTGDGVVDPVLPVSCGPLVMLRADTGAVVREAAGGGPAGLAAVYNLDRAGQPEVVNAGPWFEVQAYRSDFTLLWRESPGRMSYMVFGTFAECPGEVRYVQGAYESPTLRIWHGATGALRHEITLAGGSAWPSPAAAVAAGVRPGFLGNATAKSDLTGTGTPGALVGSTDGFLYALNPCDGTVIWALNFRFPVGEAVFADVNDDGVDDVLVSVADGYLYGVGRERFRAPAEVLDTDPPGGFPDVDRDTIETFNTLYASWTAVTGATSYEYGIVTPSGSFVTRPDFINVGGATTATAHGLGLRLGATYYVAVRAIGPAGSSSEALSDGIQLVDETPPTVTLRAAPNPFSPDADGADDTVNVVAEMADRAGLASWRLVVFYPGGMVVARSLPPQALAGTSVTDFVVWDGVDDAGWTMPEALYPVVATVEDVAGRTATASLDLEILFLPAADADADGDADADAEEDAGADGDADVLEDAADADA